MFLDEFCIICYYCNIKEQKKRRSLCYQYHCAIFHMFVNSFQGKYSDELQSLAPPVQIFINRTLHAMSTIE